MEDSVERPAGRRRIRWGCWTTVILVLALPVACVAVYVTPTTQTLETVRSPDGKWAAIARMKMYASIFTAPDFIVAVRPRRAWFGWMQEKTVFEIPLAAEAQFSVRWADSKTLVIEPTLKGQVPDRVEQYPGLQVRYIPR